MRSYRFTIKGLDCANCAREVEEKLQKMKEYNDVTVNFSTSKISLKTQMEGNIKDELEKKIQSIEPDVRLFEDNEEINDVERNSNEYYLKKLVLYIIFLQ